MAEWHKVEDKLPDKDGEYIVTVEWSIGGREVTSTEYTETRGFLCETQCCKVVAWQELPLPFEK